MTLVNGTIYTMDAQNTVAEAIAVKDGRILAVGTNEEILSRYLSTDTIDLKGMTVFPGFIDGHAHLVGLGRSLMELNLVGTTSPEQVATMVAERVDVSKPGEWIRGRGWDQNDWAVREFPTHEVLDRVAPDHPVCLVRVDGHAVWVNKKALEIVGVIKETGDPEGGKILRRPDGGPTGVLIDRAMTLVSSKIPRPTGEQIRQAVQPAVKECLKYGLTGVQDMGVGLDTLRVYKSMIDKEELPFRIYALIDGPGETWDAYAKNGREVGYGDQRLTVRSLKLFIDGALGSRGAALLEPYSDDPSNRGLTLLHEEELYKISKEALEEGFQVCTHAIGDRGNRMVLDTYEKVIRETAVTDHRFRIEHAQVVALSDIPRFKQIGILPSMQPIHCTSDMYWAEARLGPERIRGAYAWRKFLETGSIIVGGSDFPVEHPNPLWGIHAAVTRQDHEGRPGDWHDVLQHFQLPVDGVSDPRAFAGGWYADQKMTREEAIRSFTTWAAYGAFEEGLKGSLEPGKLADMVVLTQDIMTIPASEILHTEVVMTIVGGEIAYQIFH
jgi:predicted amidohydrolase YtcJ